MLISNAVVVVACVVVDDDAVADVVVFVVVVVVVAVVVFDLQSFWSRGPHLPFSEEFASKNRELKLK